MNGMLKNGLRLFILSSIIVLFSGCFEIIEEIDINADGSGSFELTINLSQSKTKLKSLMLLDSINGFEIPSRKAIEYQIEKIYQIALSNDSLSGVESSVDFNDFIFSLKCDFKNVESLNITLEKIEEVFDVSKFNNFEKHFSYSTEDLTFTRNGNYFFTPGVKNIALKNEEIANTSQYICVSRFENTVTKVENDEAFVSPNSKAVMIRKNLSEIISDSSILNNAIELK